VGVDLSDMPDSVGTISFHQKTEGVRACVRVYIYIYICFLLLH
jgi:hypothetical protein